MQVQAGDFIASEASLREGTKVVPIFMPHGGLVSPAFPNTMQVTGRLCKITEVSDAEPEFINERDHFNVGKRRLPVNDGVNWTVTLTGEGNAYALQAALKGQNLRQYAGVRQGATLNNAGDLVLIEAGKDGVVLGSTYIPDCNIKFANIPGASDGESTMSIEITTSGNVMRMGDYVIPVKEIWLDPVGTTVNATAPDGTLDDFVLGTGTGSAVAEAPLAASIDPDGSGAARYILRVALDGAVTTAYTFVHATSTLTLNSVPADGAKLEVTYGVKTGAPLWSSTEQYGIGSVVQGSNGTYYTNAAAIAAIGQDPIAGAPWAAFTGFGVTPGTTPVIPHFEAMLKTWIRIVSTI